MECKTEIPAAELGKLFKDKTLLEQQVRICCTRGSLKKGNTSLSLMFSAEQTDQRMNGA